MSEQSKEQPVISGKEITTTVVAVGAAAGQALVVSPAAAPTALAMAAVLVALFPPLVAAISEAGIRRMRSRADRFFQTVVDTWAKDADMTATEVTGLLEAHKEDPHVAEAIWRAVRSLMDAPSDHAAIPLGVLAADYTREKRQADAFFRGTVRLLADLSAEEISEFFQIIGWTLSHTKGTRVDFIARDVEINSSDRATWKIVPWTLALRDSGAGSESEILYPGTATDAGRLLYLLKTTGLARESSVRFFDYNPPTAELERHILERLLRVLGGK